MASNRYKDYPCTRLVVAFGCVAFFVLAVLAWRAIQLSFRDSMPEIRQQIERSVMPTAR